MPAFRDRRPAPEQQGAAQSVVRIPHAGHPFGFPNLVPGQSVLWSLVDHGRKRDDLSGGYVGRRTRRTGSLRKHADGILHVGHDRVDAPCVLDARARNSNRRREPSRCG